MPLPHTGAIAAIAVAAALGTSTPAARQPKGGAASIDALFSRASAVVIGRIETSEQVFHKESWDVLTAEFVYRVAVVESFRGQTLLRLAPDGCTPRRTILGGFGDDEQRASRICVGGGRWRLAVGKNYILFLERHPTTPAAYTLVDHDVAFAVTDDGRLDLWGWSPIVEQWLGQPASRLVAELRMLGSR
jgi:hypothetical protein